MATSAKTVSDPVGPGVGKAWGLDAAGSSVGCAADDLAGADVSDAPVGADDGAAAWLGACKDDPALTCGTVTDETTGAEGWPECDAMQAVVVRASAATPQPVAKARRTLTPGALKVSMAQILARPRDGERQTQR